MSKHKKRYTGGNPRDIRNWWRWRHSGAMSVREPMDYRPERRSLWLGQIVSWRHSSRMPSPLAVVIGILDSGRRYRLRYLDPLTPGEVISSSRELLPASLLTLYDPRRHYSFRFVVGEIKALEVDYFLAEGTAIELNPDVPHQLGVRLTTYQPELGEFVLMISSDNRFLLGQVERYCEDSDVSVVQLDASEEIKPVAILVPDKRFKISPANLAPVSVEDLENSFPQEISRRADFHLPIEPTNDGGSKCGPSPIMRRPYLRSKS